MRRMKRETFLSGAFALAAAGLISKVLGALYRIPLYPVLGSQGMGLFQMAYPVYAIILVLSTTGVNVAVSKLVAENLAVGNGRGAWRVFHVSLVLLTIMGLLLSLGLYACAGFVANRVTKDPRAYLSLVAISPAVFFVSVMSAYRGLFQGMQVMTPTAVSQVIEQVVRVATMIGLAVLLIPRGVEYAAAGASFGAVTGAVAGLAYLMTLFIRVRDDLLPQPLRTGTVAEGGLSTVKRVVSMAVPVSLASGVLGIIQLLDMAIVPTRLQSIGHTYEQATALYGQLSGGALPLMNLPTIFAAALQVSLVPSISEARALGDMNLAVSRAATALRITSILMMPAVAGLYVLNRQIPALLYGDPEVGVSLAPLAPGALFLSLQQATAGVLQGLGMMADPVRNLAWGAVAKFLLTWGLTGISSLGIKGAAFGTSAAFFVAAILNLFALARALGPGVFSVGDMLVRPAVSSAAMGLTVISSYSWLASHGLSGSAATAGVIFIGMTTYGVVLLLVGGLKARDVELLPGIGPRLKPLLARLGLLK